MVHRLEEQFTRFSVGSHCDACTRRLSNGDRVFAYAVCYPDQPWRLRRFWCPACTDSDLPDESSGPDQAIISAVMWRNQLAAVEVDAVVLPSGDESEVVLGED